MTDLTDGWFKSWDGGKSHYYRHGALSSACGLADRLDAEPSPTLISNRCRICKRILEKAGGA